MDQDGEHSVIDTMEAPSPQVVRLAARLIRLQSQFEPRSRDLEFLRGVGANLNSAIVDAIGHNAFFYEYQPVVSTADGALEGYEALVRWRRGDRAVPPIFFLPIAEETGAIVEMQQRLLNDVAAAYAQLSAPVSIALNWSSTAYTNCASIRGALLLRSPSAQ